MCTSLYTSLCTSAGLGVCLPFGCRCCSAVCYMSSRVPRWLLPLVAVLAGVSSGEDCHTGGKHRSTCVDRAQKTKLWMEAHVHGCSGDRARQKQKELKLRRTSPESFAIGRTTREEVELLFWGPKGIEHRRKQGCRNFTGTRWMWS